MVLVKTKKWGNSIGVILPKEIVREQGITEEAEIDVDITRKSKNVLRELWDFGKKSPIKISRKDLIEIRKNESKFL